MAKPRLLPIAQITLDPDLQPRVRTNQATIDNYAEVIRHGTEFEPVVVFSVNGQAPYLLADGWHRIAAYKAADKSRIPVEIRPGGKDQALEYSLGANSKNPLPMRTADKQRAIGLAAKRWPHYSDRQIAAITGTTHPTVAKVREALARGEQPVDPDEVEKSTAAPVELVVDVPAGHEAQMRWIRTLDRADIATAALSDPRLETHPASWLTDHRRDLEHAARIRTPKELREYLAKMQRWSTLHAGHVSALKRRLAELAVDEGEDVAAQIPGLVDPQVAITWCRRRVLSSDDRWRCLLASILLSRARAQRNEYDLKAGAEQAAELGLIACAEAFRKKVAALQAKQPKPEPDNETEKAPPLWQRKQAMMEASQAEILASSDVLVLAMVLSEAEPPCEIEPLVERLAELGSKIVRCPSPPCRNRPYAPQKDQTYYTLTCPNCHDNADRALAVWDLKVKAAQQVLAWQVAKLAPSAAGGELWINDDEGNPVQVHGLRMASPWELGDLVPELRRAPAPAPAAPTVAERFRAQSVRVGAVWVRRGVVVPHRPRVYVTWTDAESRFAADIQTRVFMRVNRLQSAA